MATKKKKLPAKPPADGSKMSKPAPKAKFKKKK